MRVQNLLQKCERCGGEGWIYSKEWCGYFDDEFTIGDARRVISDFCECHLHHGIHRCFVVDPRTFEVLQDNGRVMRLLSQAVREAGLPYIVERSGDGRVIIRVVDSNR